MKVLKVDLFRDGGSRMVVTDQGVYLIYSKDWLVYDGWPRGGGRLVSSQLQALVIAVADAFQAGQDYTLAYTYNTYDVRIIAEDFAKAQVGTANTPRFNDWFNTHSKFK